MDYVCDIWMCHHWAWCFQCLSSVCGSSSKVIAWLPIPIQYGSDFVWVSWLPLTIMTLLHSGIPFPT